MFYGFLNGSRAPYWARAPKALLPRVWNRPQGRTGSLYLLPHQGPHKRVHPDLYGVSTKTEGTALSKP